MQMTQFFLPESSTDLKQLIRKGKEESAKTGPRLNVRKTEITNTEELHNFTVDIEDIETVRAFAHLGSIISPNGDFGQGIRKNNGTIQPSLAWYLKRFSAMLPSSTSSGKRPLR